MKNDLYVKIPEFKVGSELIATIQGVEIRAKSTLVGMNSREYLIIQTPKVSGIDTKVYEGNRLSVAFISSGVVYGFKSVILNSINNPEKLLFIAYPDAFEHRELRVGKRIECCFPATVRLSDGMEFEGAIIDISATGCKYTAVSVPREQKASFQPGVKIHLIFELLGMEGMRTVEGEIKNLTQDSKKLSLGIRFDETDESILGKIQDYILSVSDLL